MKYSLYFEDLENAPGYRPKVYKVQIKQYGLRKVVRVRTRKNGDVKD